MKKIIKNIAELVQVEKKPKKWVAGSEMSKIQTIKDAYLEIENERITDFGCMKEWKGIDDWNNIEIIDAEEGTVFPSYCDSHSHIVFSHSREQEFIDKINGLSYQQIAEKGGGIINSAIKLRNTTEENLYESALNRLKEVTLLGTGAIEIKSGYGLNLESEIKMLRVIKKLKETSPITIKSTFLAAHAVPPEYKNNKDQYLDLIIDKMLPVVAKENLDGHKQST